MGRSIVITVFSLIMNDGWHKKFIALTWSLHTAKLIALGSFSRRKACTCWKYLCDTVINHAHPAL
jgi:hypothetical protein